MKAYHYSLHRNGKPICVLSAPAVKDMPPIQRQIPPQWLRQLVRSALAAKAA